MRTPLFIVGCGGFGREVFNIVQAVNSRQPQWNVEAFVDDRPSDQDLQRVSALGSGYLGTVDTLAQHPGPFSALVAVGNAAARANIVGKLANASVAFPVLLHPEATLGPDVIVGPGSIVAAGARLSANVIVGQHVQIDQNATIGHDTRIGDFARLNPQACVSGSVAVGTRSLIGASATVLQGLCIGDGAVVGAAACVVHNVANETTVKGVPAR